eukprot:TRINITY_DN7813_c0_g1_i3.p1 TRINITY_DN7813_c0_g1~~TRINITY_DN7813_c0_g1_i3.p1  ORF type:complete len:258 (-),score=27.44 TRINITY_DN7813_c0_g1_i3:158-931(-)
MQRILTTHNIIRQVCRRSAVLSRGFGTIPPDVARRNQDIVQNFEPINEMQRWQLIVQSALGAFRDPERADLVSSLGDLTSFSVLLDLKEKMERDETGRQILREKPRIKDLDMSQLLALPSNTFGYHYYSWMKHHEFKPEERPLVKYIPDFDLAYIMQRYKEIHDYIHTLLSFDVTVENELAVKWFEMIQFGFPSTAMSAYVGPLMLQPNDMKLLVKDHIPKIIENARRCPFALNIYFEKHFDMDITEFRQRLRLSPI